MSAVIRNARLSLDLFNCDVNLHLVVLTLSVQLDILHEPHNDDVRDRDCCGGHAEKLLRFPIASIDGLAGRCPLDEVLGDNERLEDFGSISSFVGW